MEIKILFDFEDGYNGEINATVKPSTAQEIINLAKPCKFRDMAPENRDKRYFSEIKKCSLNNHTI